MNDLLKRLTSRRFLLALIGIYTVFFNHLSGDQTAAITALIIAYTGSAAIVDTMSN